MSDLFAALAAVKGLKAAMAAHLDGLNPAPPRAHFNRLDEWYYSVSKKAESIELAKEIVRSDVWEQFGTLSQELPFDSRLIEVKGGILAINLNAKNADTFLLSVLEHLVSTAKNVTDVYAVLLNELWQLNQRPLTTNIITVSDAAGRRNAQHPLIAIARPLSQAQSWYGITGNIRNACQHRDSTGILVARVGRDAAPSIDPNFFHPNTNEQQRSVTNFCPWLADQVYQFIENAGAALAAAPGL